MLSFTGCQVQGTGAPVSYVGSPNKETPPQRWLQYQAQQHCPINKHKTPSERTVPEFRYFVFFVHRWFALSLFLWDCRNAHCDMDSWFLKPRLRVPTELIQVTAELLVSLSVLILWRQGDHCCISNQFLSNC